MSSSSSLSSGGSDSDEEFGHPIATQTLPTPQIQGLRICDHVLVTQFREGEIWTMESAVPCRAHVDGSLSQASSVWALNDFAILSWYNATTTPLTLEIIKEHKGTTYML